MDGFGSRKDVVIDELAGAEQKREEVVIVDSPNSVASGWLQIVS